MSSFFRDRLDLSDWLVHFVHAPAPDHLPYDEELPPDTSPFLFLPNVLVSERLFDTWEIKEQEMPLPCDAPAFQVLRRILEDGYIRCTWSFRRRAESAISPLIYGSRPACCFTEMPLYALLKYAKQRQNTKSVATYAIALRRNEVFRAGGRPVIYGLSSKHREVSSSVLFPRLLDPACGISEGEQYRYVAMNLGDERVIDWSHEREWRWGLSDTCICPGLPVWLQGDMPPFSQILVIVARDKEREDLLCQLKEMHDAGCDPYCVEYRRTDIENTLVVSLEEALRGMVDAKTNIRIEDIPSHRLQTFRVAIPSEEYVKRVECVLTMASEAATQAASLFRQNAQKDEQGFIRDVCGFADLVIHDSQSELVQALLVLDAVTPLTRIGYKVKGLTAGCLDQALSEKEAAIAAALEVFEKGFPEISFSTRSRWD